MLPAHPFGIPHGWPGSLLRKCLLKAQFGAVLSGDKPTCFPSLALCCALQADKGQLSSASCSGHPPRLQGQHGHHPHSPKYLHLWGKADCTCKMPQPSRHSHRPSTCIADTTGHLIGVCAPRSVCCHTRAKSCRCGSQVSARGCAQCLYSLPAPSPYQHSCSSQCNLGGWAGRRPTKTPDIMFSFASNTASSLLQ